ncbi:hypothetical protein EI94DRAFT_908094 [Lactarius quietus]|nr:hypothetical protein EI94DRAFT_908094 [Lactarius quietus]
MVNLSYTPLSPSDPQIRTASRRVVRTNIVFSPLGYVTYPSRSRTSRMSERLFASTTMCITRASVSVRCLRELNWYLVSRKYGPLSASLTFSSILKRLEFLEGESHHVVLSQSRNSLPSASWAQWRTRTQQLPPTIRFSNNSLSSRETQRAYQCRTYGSQCLGCEEPRNLIATAC